MKNKLFLILLIGSYLLAFSVNLMPAMKYPDLQVDVIDLSVSLMFIGFLFIYVMKGSRIFKIFLMLGVLSGIVIFLLNVLLTGNEILDVIANIQYPFYFIFTIPLFGGNLLLGISPEAFSLTLSMIYAVVWGLTLHFEKQQVQTVH